MSSSLKSVLSIEQCNTWAGLWRPGVRVAVMTGAGISTESGIPDFRSPGGVWATCQPVDYRDFMDDPEARQEYWRQKTLAHPDFVRAQPNDGHRLLAQYEADGILRPLITQNIDGLHQRAGSRIVLELHGSALHVACQDCDFRDAIDQYHEAFLSTGHPPACPQCAGRLKHATISFGQSLNGVVLADAFQAARDCDVFIVIGSSLVVEPAASLPLVAQQHGAQLAILNREPTPLDRKANHVIHGEIGPTMRAIEAHRRTLH